jgi:iron complex outermembrane receptor protein
LLLALVPGVTYAQEDESASRYSLEEVTVTARRREESLQNAAIAVTAISGLELEANYLVNDNFRLDASIGYLDTELNSISAENGEFILNSGNNLQKTITANSGVELPHAPGLQANLGTSFSFFVGNGGEIRNRIDYFYEGEQYSSIGNYNQDRIPSTSRVNYTASYIPDNGSWEATIGVRNLTDEENILNTAIESGPRAGIYHVLGRGREAYVQFKYSFGD